MSRILRNEERFNLPQWLSRELRELADPIEPRTPRRWSFIYLTDDPCRALCGDTIHVRLPKRYLEDIE